MSELTRVLDEIEARTNAATPGPWEWAIDLHERNLVWLTSGSGRGLESILPGIQAFRDLSERPNSKFIAAARTDVPKLVQALRRSLKGLDKVKAYPGGVADIAYATTTDITKILTEKP